MASETLKSGKEEEEERAAKLKTAATETASQSRGALESASKSSLGGGESGAEEVRPPMNGLQDSAVFTSDDEKSEKSSPLEISPGNKSSQKFTVTDSSAMTNGTIDSVKREGDGPGGEPKTGGLKQEGADAIPREQENEERAVAYSLDNRFLKYDIEIGRGSFKTVYKGLDTETGVAVAWCELQENRYNKAEQARFKEEVAILKTLQHPNILKLYDSWEVTQKVDKKDRKVLILITELMTSGTLKGYMRRLKAIKPKVIRSWGRQILRGLLFLHTRTPPIIHRDLKCDNIFINGTTGLVKIGDLGLATLKRSDVKTVIGTPEFMAPEMYEESYDESVDIYAFGMCLLEMCTQEYPYMECTNPAQIYKKVTSGIRPGAFEKVKDPMLRDIIMNSTSVHKANRYTVKDLLNHEFFVEGVKMEVVPHSGDSAELLLRMEVPNKENKKNGQESIEFTYNIRTDEPDEVVGEMVKSGILRSEDQKQVSRSIREYLDSHKQKLRAQQEGREKQPQPPATGEALPEGDGGQAPKLSRQVSAAEGSEGEAGEGNHRSPELPPVTTTQEKGRVTPSGLPPMQDPGTGKSEVITSPVQGASKPLLEPPPSGLTLSGQVQLVLEQQKSPNVGPGAADDYANSSHPLAKSKPANEAVPVPGRESSKLVPVASDPSPQQGNESLSRTGSLSRSHSEDQQPASTQQQQLPPMSSSQETTPTSTTTASTQSLPEKHPEGPQTLQQNPPAEGSLEPQPTPPATTATTTTAATTATTSSTFSTATSSSSLNGSKKKPSRGKKKLRLNLVEVMEDGVAKCTLATAGGQVVKFQFSVEYDKPQEIFQKFVKARHLVEPDQGEFIQQTERLLSEAKKIRRSSSSTLASKEERESGQGKAELPSESASKPFPVAVVTAEDAKPLLGPTPEPPPSAERTDVKTTASVNKPVDENTSAPQGGVSPPKPDAAPPSSVPPDSAIVSSALVKTEAQATRPASPPKLPESTPAVTTTAGSFTITQESQPKPVQALLSEAVPVSDTRPEAVRASDPRLEVVVVSQAQQQTSPILSRTAVVPSTGASPSTQEPRVASSVATFPTVSSTPNILATQSFSSSLLTSLEAVPYPLSITSGTELPIHHTPLLPTDPRLPSGLRQASDPPTDNSLQLYPGSAAAASGSGYQTWPASTSPAYCPISSVSYVTQASITAGMISTPHLVCPTTYTGYVPTGGFEPGAPIMSYGPVAILPQQIIASEPQSQPIAVAGSKTFEVEDVTEVTDSPTPSEDAASSNSTTSLDKEGEATPTPSQTDVTTVTQEQAPRTQTQAQTRTSSPPILSHMASGGLESTSGSSVGIGESSASVTPTDYQPVAPAISQTELSSSLAYSATQPNLPAQSQPQPEQEPPRRRSSSLPQSTTSFAQAQGPMPSIPESDTRHSMPELEMSATLAAGPVLVPQEGNPASYPPSYSSRHPDPISQPTLEQIPPHHVQLLTKAFGTFLHAMNKMLRDPAMEPLIHSLDRQFGDPNLQSPTTSQPSSQPVSPTSASSGPGMSPRVSITTQTSASESDSRDPEYAEIMAKFEEEQRQLNERKKQAIESYRRKKGGGSSDAATRSLSPLGGGDRRNVSLSEYQEVPRGATPSEERDRMEQKVKEELMSNFLTTSASEHGSSSEAVTSLGTRGLPTPTNSPMRERRQRSHSHVQTGSSKTAVVSRAVPQAAVSTPGGSNRVASSMALPAPLRIPQVPSGVSPGSSSSSNSLAVASSPAVLPNSASSMLTNPSTQQQRPPMSHSDSGEWTPYTSAPPPASGSGASVSNLIHTGSGAGNSEVFSKTAVLSEFDPMAKNQSL